MLPVTRMHGRLWGASLLLVIAAACSTPRAASDGHQEADRPAFDRRSVALMRLHSFDEAEQLRDKLRRGDPLPPTTTIIPLAELDRLDPELSTVAARLGECAISQPIPPGHGRMDGDYALLQRGSSAETPCEGAVPVPPERSTYDTIEEHAGQVLIGLLMVGLAGLLIALPFLL